MSASAAFTWCQLEGAFTLTPSPMIGHLAAEPLVVEVMMRLAATTEIQRMPCLREQELAGSGASQDSQIQTSRLKPRKRIADSHFATTVARRMGTREITAGLSTRDAGASAEFVDEREASGLTWLALSAVVAAIATLIQVGADARWLAALGGHIATTWTLPDELPYAAAASSGWQNAPVLGELVFHFLYAVLADRGLVFAQIVAVAAALGFLWRDMREARVTDAAAALVLVATALAAAPALLVVRAQLFSIAFFPLIALLLRAETRNPSRRIWLAVPLVALWSNLHGAVLVGVLVTAAYLVLDRLRREPAVALSVLAACGAALLATPALFETAVYYRDVLTSEVAARGNGLWAPLSLQAPFDVLFLFVGIPLCLAALRARPPAWELAVLAGLGLMAVQANRNTVWLALFAAVPAARALRLGSRSRRGLQQLLCACAALLGIAIVAALVRVPVQTAAGPELLRRTANAARETPILADPLNAEQLVLAGQRIWIGNPLDAFDRRDQRLYLDWLEGRRHPLEVSGRSCAVVVMADSVPQRRLARTPGFRELGRDAESVLYGRPACAAR